jgi:plastocyanin
MRKRWLFAGILLLGSVTLAGSYVSKSTAAVTPEPALAGGTVTISNFQFTPRVVRIKAGGSVDWQVKEGTHTVNADDGSFGSSGLSAGQKFSHQFPKPGRYRYYCSFHGSKGGHDMAGTVIVTR